MIVEISNLWYTLPAWRYILLDIMVYVQSLQQCVVDLGRALVIGEFGSSRVPSHIDAKFKSFRAIVEKAHG